MDRGASALRVERLPDAAAFLERATGFLMPREAENCLIFGLCANLRTGITYGPRPPYFAIVTDDEADVGAAMRTPPFNLIVAAGTDPRAVSVIGDDILQSNAADLAGVVGPKDLTGTFIRHWRGRTGSHATLKTAERIYRLARVQVPPRGPARGFMRLAEPADGALVAEWFLGFAHEALRQDDPAGARTNAERWIGQRALHLWMDDGRPVSMAGASGPTPNGIRIGAVYTPPRLRKRGYAGTLVATVSQAQLERGRAFCFLYTDLANPTSNKIYQEIGYEPVCDVDEYRFEAGG